MNSIEQQIEDLRHWADMAELTAEKISCLTPGQLRNVADSLEGLLSRTTAAVVAGCYIYHYSAVTSDSRVHWNGIAMLDYRIVSMDELERLKKTIGETFKTSISSIQSLSYLGREHDS